MSFLSGTSKYDDENKIFWVQPDGRECKILILEKKSGTPDWLLDYASLYGQ